MHGTPGTAVIAADRIGMDGAWAMPKSVTMAMPSSVSRILAGLMSRG